MKKKSVLELFQTPTKKEGYTPLEIQFIVQKSRGSIYKEIKSLINHNLITRVEIPLFKKKTPIIIYIKK